MVIKRLPRPRDPIQLAKLIGDIATGQVVDGMDDGKDAAAVESGRRGAAVRAQSISPQRKAEIARQAASNRWQKGRPGQPKKEPV